MPHEIAAPGTVRIVLHGRLRKKFGPEFNLGVGTAAGAVAALMALKPGFREALEPGQYTVRRGTMRRGFDLPETGLNLKVLPGGEIHIIPRAAGAKQGGVGKVIAGAVLVIAAVVLAVYAPYAAAGLAEIGLSATAGTITGFAGSLAMTGVGMVLTGITAMIAPQPKANQNAQNGVNYLLSGLTNTVSQGACVPVVYGRARVGSVVVSAGYEAIDFVPDTYTPPVGETFPGPQGGTTPSGGTTTVGGTTGPANGGQGDTATGGGGGGKGGGGSGGGGSESPDTLHSRAVVRIIDVLSEGPIGGLVDGLKSIFINGVPVQDSAGSMNFRGINFELRTGDPDQDPVPGYPASESSEAVNLHVLQATPVVKRITGSAPTAARVTVRIPQLYSVNAQNGDIKGTDLAYRIEVRPSQLGAPGFVGTWSEMVSVQLRGQKTVSPYQRSHRFPLPRDGGADTWDVRLTRITDDSADVAHLQNDLYFDLLDTIVDHQLIYPNTAYIAMTVDSRVFGSSIPSRQYEIYGRSVSIPSNYDPYTHAYASSGAGTSGGTWDLVSTYARPTDNPAFIFLDMLSHPRYGASVSDAYLQVLRANLYVIAQYCDGLVPDGFGSYERRYAVNAVIAQQESAYGLMQTMVSAFRGMTYWGAGQIAATADMPFSPAKLFNQTNVIGGSFGYSGTSQKTRPNVVRVAYLDATNQYAQSVEPVYDAEDIALRGASPAADIVAWGCTSRGRAHRLGKWYMYTSRNQNRTVTFKTGWYGADTMPGMIIAVADPYFAGARTGGRLRSITAPAGANLIASSVSVQPGAVSPNAVSAASGVPELAHGTAVWTHARAAGAEANCGYLAVTAGAGTYWISCHVWIPAAFTGTAVSFVCNASSDPSALVLLDPGGAAVTLSNGTVLAMDGGHGVPGSANLDLRDQWQRVAFRVTLSGSASVSGNILVGAASPQVIHSTAWCVDPTGYNAYAATSGGIAVVRDLHLDQFFVPDGSSNYLVSVVMPDGTVDQEIGVDGFTDTPDHTVVHIARPLAKIPSPNAEWIVTSTNLAPQLFQVLAMTEDERGTFSITAVNHDPDKFDWVERGIRLHHNTYSNLPSRLISPLPVPTNVAARDYMSGVGVTQVLRVTVSWTAPLDPRVDHFEVYASGTGIFQTHPARGSSLDVDGLPPQSYTFGVRSVAADGRVSAWATIADPLEVDGSVDPPAAPGSLTALGGTRRITLSWAGVSNRRDILHYEVWRSNSASSPPWAGGSRVAVVSANTWVDTQGNVLVPASTWYYWVRGVASGSPAVDGYFAGPVNATTSRLIADDIADGILNTAKFASSISLTRIIASYDVIVDTNFDTVPIGDYAVSQADRKLYVRRVRGTGVIGYYLDYDPVVDLSDVVAHIGNQSITTAMIANGAITTTLLALGGVTTTKIADGAITTPLLGAGAVVAENIAAGAVVANKIGANAVTAAKILANTAWFDQLTAGVASFGGLRASEIAAGEIRATHLATDFALVNIGQFGTVEIDNAHIGTLAVGTDNIDYRALSAVTSSYNTFSEYLAASTWRTVATVSLTVVHGTKILLLATAASDGSGTPWSNGGGGGSEGG